MARMVNLNSLFLIFIFGFIFEVHSLYNGLEAEKGQFPFSVGIKGRESMYDPECCGIIITNRHVLTPAWCFTRLENVTVKAGCINWFAEDCVTYNVESVTIHPDYVYGYNLNNIAVITTANDIVFDENVNSISISTDSVQNLTAMTLSGWKSWGFYELSWLEVHSVEEKLCRQQDNADHENFMCSNPGGQVAAGDWGGPVIVNGELVGMMMTFGQYDVHLRIEKYIDFINGVINRK